MITLFKWLLYGWIVGVNVETNNQRKQQKIKKILFPAHYFKLVGILIRFDYVVRGG